MESRSVASPSEPTANLNVGMSETPPNTSTSAPSGTSRGKYTKKPSSWKSTDEFKIFKDFSEILDPKDSSETLVSKQKASKKLDSKRKYTKRSSYWVNKKSPGNLRLVVALKISPEKLIQFPTDHQVGEDESAQNSSLPSPRVNELPPRRNSSLATTQVNELPITASRDGTSASVGGTVAPRAVSTKPYISFLQSMPHDLLIDKFEYSMQSLKFQIDTTFQITIFTVHMPAVGLALRDPIYDSMKGNVDHALRSIFNHVLDSMKNIYELVGSHETMSALVKAKPHVVQNPTPLAMLFDLSIPGSVLQIRPVLLELHKNILALPDRIHDLLILPGMRAQNKNGEFAPFAAGKVTDQGIRSLLILQFRVQAAKDSVAKIRDETKRLRLMLENPPPPPNQ